MKRLFIQALVFLIGCSGSSFAQKTGKPNQPEETKTTKPPAKPTEALTDEEKFIFVQGLTREEKNTMDKCPLHDKPMELSDNYRANASDFRVSDETPFAYQLNYRRYCAVCTKNLLKEEKAYNSMVGKRNDTGTFDRCEIHNKSLLMNGDANPTGYEKKPSQDYPNAQQYKFKTYCKACTKAHAADNKGKENTN